MDQKHADTVKAFDVVVVGAGFGGLPMLHRLREMGLSARVFEAGGGVGGTWYWNRYPGCRCDVESLEYSYSFSEALQQDWEWTERFPGRPEILDYLNHVTDRFGLRDDIEFNTRVTAAVYDETANRWQVDTDSGPISARFCVMATGCLSSTNTPDFPGLHSFEGDIYHTGNWPHEEVDFSGKRVGIIGTGSSSIQSTPVIAEAAQHLYVFQRTPNFSVPARNALLDPEVQAQVKAKYAAYRKQQRALPFACHYPPRDQSGMDVTPEEREALFEEYWAYGELSFLSVFSDLITNAESNEAAAEFIRSKIRAIVKDPETAEKLCPDHHVGCKRPCSDTEYYEAFNRDNVSLVDVSETPISAITPKGVDVGARAYALDAIVFATGFDAMTGSLDKINIRGREDLPLKDKWKAGPRTYLGVTTVGFPNLFFIAGPGSPSVLANMVTSVEHHVEWIADAIAHLAATGKAHIEPTAAAEDAWVIHVNEVAGQTLYPTCNSWYLGANIPGKPRIFMPYIGGFPRYERKCEEFVANGYEGFAIA